MPAKSPCCFADLLKEAVPEKQDSANREPNFFKARQQSRPDSIRLSVQAQKALPNTRPTDKFVYSTPPPMTASKQDSQGNEIRISARGNELASTAGSKIAWETVLKKPDESEAAEPGRFLPVIIASPAS